MAIMVSMATPVMLQARPVQLQGSAVATAVLRLLGWRIQFDGLPALQGVIVAYPHTSNWDFPLAMLAKWAMGIPITFWGKDSLFRWPLLGRWMRWIGGVPVLRHTPQGAVGQMVLALQAAREHRRFMWLALSPEGTRRLTSGWRSGFYRAAQGAQVPVGLAFFDYANRCVGVDSYWQLSGDPSADMACFAERLRPYRGKRHEWAAPVRLL
jgi:1-acyl-sn-glycerol-3-phosphate acyltransferase